MTTCKVYGSRTAADAYPSYIYRVFYPVGRAEPEVEHLFHGRWLPAIVKAGDIQSGLERGMFWELTGGVHDWSTTQYVKHVELRICVPETALFPLVNGDFHALDECHVISGSHLEQTDNWYLVQWHRSGPSLFATPHGIPGSQIFNLAAAAEKRFAKMVEDIHSPVVLTPKSLWEADISAAAFEILDERKRAIRAAEQWKVVRLSELRARPTVELTQAEYIEKRRLQRELS